MTTKQGRTGTIDVKALPGQDEEFLRALMRTALQEVLEAEMTEGLGAEKGERSPGRRVSQGVHRHVPARRSARREFARGARPRSRDAEPPDDRDRCAVLAARSSQ